MKHTQLFIDRRAFPKTMPGTVQPMSLCSTWNDIAGNVLPMHHAMWTSSEC